MASGILVGRPRFAAVLTFVFVGSVFGPLMALAQEVVAPDEFIPSEGPVFEDDTGPPACGCNNGSGYGCNRGSSCGCNNGSGRGCGDGSSCGCGDIVQESGDYWNAADNCACGACNECDQVCYKSHCRGWLNAEYLLWHLNGSYLPPLVTDGPSTAPTASVGELDDSSTRILFGNETVGDDWRSGYRFTGGFWLNDCRSLGISGDYFDVNGEDVDFQAGPNPNRIVTRPFFNTQLNEADAELVAVPNQLDGTVRVSADDEFQGAGITLSQCIWSSCNRCGCGPTTNFKLLSGYRYYQYDSGLSISENLTVLPGTTTQFIPGTRIFVEDRFATRNEFHGGEIGLQGCCQQRCWWVDGLAKIAIGSNCRTVIIDGTTVNTVPNVGTSSFEGGLLTSEVTNIGRYKNRDTVVIPEFRLGVGRSLSCCCAVRMGYNVIIWPNVTRAASYLPPGLEVDPRNLPPVQTGGGNEPTFTRILNSELLAHGLDASIQWTF